MTIYCVNPRGSMDQLSHIEVELLTKKAKTNLYELYRNCSLAVLNSGAITDDSRFLLNQHPDFDIHLIASERGISLELHNPPKEAFVDDTIIRNIQYHLFAVLRDILFVNVFIHQLNPCNQPNPKYITNQVFAILRNARALIVGELPNLVVCWGGHSINEVEYQYCRNVGLEMGLRELNIITGCGPGIMEAPMKGAAIGHANQRYHKSRFIGITEPSIIASEPPNPIVNELIIMPDIEKRLEAFVRMGHAILIFPGGPGTFEEFLYILGIKLHPNNQHLELPVILTGPECSRRYFETLDRFVKNVLGNDISQHYEIIINDSITVAKKMKQTMERVQQIRYQTGDSYNFNWSLNIPESLQTPFEPTHESMAKLDLHLNQPLIDLIANLRCAFSGIVAGNIKPTTQDSIAQLGPFQLHGDTLVMQNIDGVLQDFVAQNRMKLPSEHSYEPCYQIIQ